MKKQFLTVIVLVLLASVVFLTVNEIENGIFSSSEVASKEPLKSKLSNGIESLSVPRYDVFEIALTAAGSYHNPYLEMPADATTRGFVVGTFTGPGGEKITIDGFWDGGSTWKIRMAPTVVGTWRYTTFSADAGLNGRN